MRGASALQLLALSLLPSACGGGAPLMYPAHTLPESKLSFVAGTSGRLSQGGLARAEERLDDAAATPGGYTTKEERSAFVRGALSRLAVAPGVAPLVMGRIGLGGHNEAGLAYTGRSFRADGRHAFEWPSLALSVGVNALLTLASVDKQPRRHVDDEAEAHTLDSGLRSFSLNSLRGVGAELPVIFGYRSDADVVKLWTGVRLGFEYDSANVTLGESPDVLFGSTGQASRFWSGGLVGFSVGLAPIEVRVEVDAAYERAHGSLRLFGGTADGTIDGWSLTPAMAISGKL